MPVRIRPTERPAARVADRGVHLCRMSVRIDPTGRPATRVADRGVHLCRMSVRIDPAGGAKQVSRAEQVSTAT